MALFDILVFPDARLRAKAAPVPAVDDEIRRIVDDMAETMYAAPGIGLAGNQVGILKRIAVVDVTYTEDKPELIVLINPEIVSRNGEVVWEEGCLSFPEVHEDVQRSAQIRVKALDRDGKPFEREAEGLLAVAIQHEVDHLGGIVFTDHMSFLKRRMIHRELAKEEKADFQEMISSLRIVFFGTPGFAVPILEALKEETQLVLVVTQPDRPTGRGRKPEPPPVKTACAKLDVEAIQPEVVKGRGFAGRIQAYSPDFIVTAAFGRLLGPSLLRVPSRDSLNVHASLLPRHRGAAPVNWAILSGDKETGVSIMRMEEGLDTGPVFWAVKTGISPHETAGELSDRLAVLGARAIIDTLRSYDSLQPEPQDPQRATYARMLAKQDA